MSLNQVQIKTPRIFHSVQSGSFTPKNSHLSKPTMSFTKKSNQTSIAATPRNLPLVDDQVQQHRYLQRAIKETEDVTKQLEAKLHNAKNTYKKLLSRKPTQATHQIELDQLQNDVKGAVDILDSAAVKMISAREQQMRRSLKIKLREIKRQLDTEKRVRFQETEKLIESENQVQGEIIWLNDLINDIQRQNRKLIKDNQKLKQRQSYLEKETQMQAVKSSQQIQKFNRLKEATEQFNKNQFTMSTQQATSPALSPKQMLNESDEDEIERCKQIIRKLRKQIQLEQDKIRQQRAAQAQEVQEVNELRNILTNCLKSAKQQLKKTKGLPVSSAKDQMMEKFTRQISVLGKLYEKAFPPKKVLH